MPGNPVNVRQTTEAELQAAQLRNEELERQSKLAQADYERKMSAIQKEMEQKLAAAKSDEERNRVLASTSSCFDVSVFELFTALCWSTTLVLVDDATALAERDAPEVSLVAAVPSVISEVLASAPLPRTVRHRQGLGSAVT